MEELQALFFLNMHVMLLIYYLTNKKQVKLWGLQAKCLSFEYYWTES